MDFVNDGYFPPYMGEEFESLIQASKGQVHSGLKLRKVFVAPTEDGLDVKVSRVIAQRISDHQLLSFPVKSLHLSLGPSNMAVNVIPPKTLGAAGGFFRRLFGASADSPTNLLQPMMWAAGASMVFLVKVDEDAVQPDKMRKFRDHIDGHNKHVVRLGEKRLVVDGQKAYRVFAFQVRFFTNILILEYRSLSTDIFMNLYM